MNAQTAAVLIFLGYVAVMLAIVFTSKNDEEQNKTNHPPFKPL